MGAFSSENVTGGYRWCHGDLRSISIVPSFSLFILSAPTRAPSSNASNHELLVISLSGTAHSFRYFVYSVLGAFQDAHVRQLDSEYWSSNSTLHFNAGIQMRHSETVLFCAFFTRFRLERGPFPLF
ncbi:hypothetical protein N7524_009397 [Penicillium chrysogenum]|nr:hypothetical protein N7524_009397 [Penicillium chrysogenum]